MKILIVEDDADLREITTRSLEKERYVVSQDAMSCRRHPIIKRHFVK